MYVLIVGAGQVGKAIASNLAGSHEVVVVERDPEIVNELTYSYDVLAVEGGGTELETLLEAGIEKADLVVACTNRDETNIVVCGTAKTVTDAFTIARVRSHNLLDTWQESQNAFGVDFMVCTDLLVAQTIFRICGFPQAQDIEAFANGLARMAEFEVGPESPLINQHVHELDQYGSITFASVFREEEMKIAHGDLVFQEGDRIVVIGSPNSVREFAMANVSGTVSNTDEVVIVGGSEIGYQVAREFEAHGFKPRLIEQDHNRAREIAKELPNTLVLKNDATDIDFLTREQISEADAVIAALNTDEKNLLVSLLAHRVGVERTLAVIEETEYVSLFNTVGIDVAINPREETAEEIIRFTRTNRTEKIAMLEHDRAEVIEIELESGSVLVDRQIADSVADLPDGVVIGAIARNGDLITPRGTTVPQQGDHVVIFIDATILDEVTEML